MPLRPSVPPSVSLAMPVSVCHSVCLSVRPSVRQPVGYLFVFTMTLFISAVLILQRGAGAGLLLLPVVGSHARASVSRLAAGASGSHADYSASEKGRYCQAQMRSGRLGKDRADEPPMG
jgi:hypothetical protein